MLSPTNPPASTDSVTWQAPPVSLTGPTASDKAPKTTEIQALERYAFIEKMLVWGAEFAKLDMPAALKLAEQIVADRQPQYLVTANLNYLMLCDQYPKLADVNASAAAVIADGHPIVARSRFANSPLPCRVAGSDMVVELAKLSAQRGYRMFFLGGAAGVGDAAAEELIRRFPGLQVAGIYSPPYRDLNSEEHLALLDRIRRAETDILLVAFGQPKGEFWIYDNYQELGVPLSIQIGASLDFLAGTARRAPRCWQRVGCEWLYRALSDPRRLIPRYSQNLLFLAKCVLGDLRQVCKR